MRDQDMEMQFADPDWQPGSSRQGRSHHEQALVVPVQIKNAPDPGQQTAQSGSADTRDGDKAGAYGGYSQGYRAAPLNDPHDEPPVRLKSRREGRLFALCARIALLVIWFTTPLVERAFHGGWIVPLLGVLFLPLTALTYTVVFALAGSVTGLGWLWVAVALLLDLTTYGSQASKR